MSWCCASHLDEVTEFCSSQACSSELQTKHFLNVPQARQLERVPVFPQLSALSADCHSSLSKDKTLVAGEMPSLIIAVFGAVSVLN